MSLLPKTVIELVQELKRLPGIGPKSAQRIALALLKKNPEYIKSLSDKLSALQRNTLKCEICHRYDDRIDAASNRCLLCRSTNRDINSICVVADSADVDVIESSHGFKGLYHVLEGLLDPLEGVGPENLTISSLLTRLPNNIQEVIVALNPDIRGETTLLFLKKIIKERAPQVRVTRLGRGLPTNSELEYVDELTMANALESRKEI